MVEGRGDFTLASVQAGGATRQSSRPYDDSRAEGHDLVARAAPPFAAGPEDGKRPKRSTGHNA